MGRRLSPQADPRPLHDAGPHAQRDPHVRPASAARRDHASEWPRRGRRHHAPADPAPLADDRAGSWRHRASRSRRAVQLADGDGQHPRHHRLSGDRPHSQRARRHRGNRGGVPEDLPGQPGVHELAAQVQRHDHRMPRQLHDRGDPGHRDDARHRRGRRRGLQRRRGWQARLGRPDLRHAARCLRDSRGSCRGVCRHRPHLSRPRTA